MCIGFLVSDEDCSLSAKAEECHDLQTYRPRVNLRSSNRDWSLSAKAEERHDLQAKG